MIFRGFRFQLSPIRQQEIIFRKFAGVCRLIYNVALEQREIWGRRNKFNFINQGREVTKLRSEFDFIREVYSDCQHQALRDLDKSFARFFAGRSQYPTPRKKGINDSFRFIGRTVGVKKLNKNWSAVRLPKIGWVKFRNTRALRGKVLNVTVSNTALGWHVSFACEIDHAVPEPIPASVGIDRGVAVTLALSTGEMLRFFSIG